MQLGGLKFKKKLASQGELFADVPLDVLEGAGEIHPKSGHVQVPRWRDVNAQEIQESGAAAMRVRFFTTCQPSPLRCRRVVWDLYLGGSPYVFLWRQGSAAIVAGVCGLGRVVLISPHLEAPPSRSSRAFNNLVQYASDGCPWAHGESNWAKEPEPEASVNDFSS